MSIKVLLIDDHELFCESIGQMLAGEVGIEVVGMGHDGRMAIELTNQLKPDIILMDISMPHLNGIEATRIITGQFESVKVIALSTSTDKRSVREMLIAGAKGYVPKTSTFKELKNAVMSVASGQMYLSSRISEIVVDGYVNKLAQKDDSAYSVLTAREREVLQLIAEGLSTKAAAKELHVSPKTIEWHRCQIMRKLGIQSVAEMVKYAINEGLICVGV
ncbi:MAG: response regulator transcription factor [Phycisphaerae bacterium]|nr:response regulator transcription factor [Phycisphaerae bacterium]